MSKSIIQFHKNCWVCNSPYTEEHHVFYGTGLRKKSEKDGMKIYLCHLHHRDNSKNKYGIHYNPIFDESIKKLGQKIWQGYYNKTEE